MHPKWFDNHVKVVHGTIVEPGVQKKSIQPSWLSVGFFHMLFVI